MKSLLALSALLLVLGCEKSQRYVLTVGMGCTLNEESKYPHVWRDKKDSNHVCAAHDELIGLRSGKPIHPEALDKAIAAWDKEYIDNCGSAVTLCEPFEEQP